MEIANGSNLYASFGPVPQRCKEWRVFTHMLCHVTASNRTKINIPVYAELFRIIILSYIAIEFWVFYRTISDEI